MPQKSKRSPKKKSAVKLKDVNYHGFKHDVVCEKMEGDLTFVNYMGFDRFVAAVYHAKKPNLEKGHKEFMLLFTQYDVIADKSMTFVSGRTREEIEKIAVHEAVVCLECNTALVSLSGHHFHGCGCKNETFVDGGRNYVRCGGKSLSKIAHAKVNMLTGEITVDKKPIR